MAIYIYCFINEPERRSFGKIGIDCEEVTFLSYRDISAAASDIGTTRLDSLDKEKLFEYVAAHQKVNEALLKEYDVVPMAFGMIAQDEGEVASMLGKCYLQLKTALKNISGKTEFVAQASWDRPLVLNEILRAYPELQELKNKASKGGIGSIRAKIKLGKLLYEKTELQRKFYVEHVSSPLKDVSHDFKFNKLIDEQMIVNLSCLIDKAKEPELDKKMTDLGEEFNGKLRFKYIGPMPPYSFTNINFSLGNFELIDEARRTLGLQEHAAWRDIRQAYYGLAQKYHPDKHGGSNETGEMMKKIIQAQGILENYCQNFGEATGQENQTFSFEKEDVESSMVVGST